jgi:hypothetical protein
MVLMDKAVYVSHRRHQNDFRLEAYDARSGELRWEWPSPVQTDEHASLARGDISWRLVGAGGMLYVPGPTALCAVRAGDGELLWQLPKSGGVRPLVAVAG